MILFTLLVIALIIAVALIAIGGAGFLVVFGDVIICAAIIVFIVKKFIGK